MILRKFVCLGLIFILFSGEVSAQEKNKQTKPVKLEAYKRIDEPARTEVSGIVKSSKFSNTYWVHGDSGTKNRIYAINSDGEIKSTKKSYAGAEVKGAKNKDWEDIALDGNGNLIVADIGNNCFCRTDLKIFIVKEPDPEDEEAEVLFEYDIEYPRGSAVSDFLFKKNHNAEAIFSKGGKIYIITKSADKKTRAQLFVLENPKEDKKNILKPIADFKFDELVTGADISSDESTIAVLTRRSIWIFKPVEGSSLFEGEKYRLRIKGIQQVESIAFEDEETLIIAEEGGELFRVKVSEIPEYKQN